MAGVLAQIVMIPEPESTAVSLATMLYDADDQLVAWNAEVTRSDANGNLVSGPLNGAVTTFSYDARDRLQSARQTMRNSLAATAPRIGKVSVGR